MVWQSIHKQKGIKKMKRTEVIGINFMVHNIRKYWFYNLNQQIEIDIRKIQFNYNKDKKF